MDASWENNLEEELLCPICLNVFEQPIQLPCRHNFCKGCITEAWAKHGAAVRCPECNHHYEQKPPLERNSKLANIVMRFNALSSGKVGTALDCALCARGPPLPARKVCLRCKEPCCQAHVQAHLQQPCAAPGHLLVDAEELSAWTCPSHEEYRLFHCEEEQVALCPFCCISHCTNQRHAVCDVNARRLQIQAALMRQQEKLDGRVVNIDERLAKLESDKTLMKATVSELKERARAQYQRMHALLEADQAETAQMLGDALAACVRKTAQPALLLKEKRREAEKLRRSLQMFFQRSGSLNFMKNTKSHQLLMNRSNLHLCAAVPPLRHWHVNSHRLLSELSSRERNLRRMLQEPINEKSILEIVLSHAGSAAARTGTGVGQQKRKYDAAFPESNMSSSASHDPPLLQLYNGKKPFPSDRGLCAASAYSSDSLPHNPHAAPGYGRILGSSVHHMVGLGPSHYSLLLPGLHAQYQTVPPP